MKSPQIIVVNAASPYRTLSDLLNAARQKPGELTIASAGPASSPHIAIEALKHAASVNINFIPYQGSTPAVNALLGEHVTAVMASYPNVAELITTGKLRALATASAARIEPMPNVPTIAESGFKDFEADIWFGLVCAGEDAGGSDLAARRVVHRRTQGPGGHAEARRAGAFPGRHLRGRITQRSRKSSTTTTAAPFATPISRRSKIRPMTITSKLALCLVALASATLPAHSQNRPRETIQVGLIDRTFFPQPVFVAIQNGYFADEGFNANIRFIRSGEGQAAGLTKGDLHFVLSSVEGIIQNVERGGPLRMIAANSGKLSHFIITQKKFAKVEDLKGGTVGILTMTEGSFFNWQEIAQKHGLKFPEDYKVLETAGAGARHHLLLDGKIDVGLQSIPWAYVAEDAGFNNLGAAADYVPDWQFTVYNVNGEWAKANARKVEGFLRAILRATDWIYRNRARGRRDRRARAEHQAGLRRAGLGLLHQDRHADARPVVYRSRPSQGVRDADQGRPAAEGRDVRHVEIRRRPLPQAGAGDRQVRSAIRSDQPQYRPLAPMITTSRPSGRLTAMIWRMRLRLRRGRRPVGGGDRALELQPRPVEQPEEQHDHHPADARIRLMCSGSLAKPPKVMNTIQ